MSLIANDIFVHFEFYFEHLHDNRALDGIHRCLQTYLNISISISAWYIFNVFVLSLFDYLINLCRVWVTNGEENSWVWRELVYCEKL